VAVRYVVACEHAIKAAVIRRPILIDLHGSRCPLCRSWSRDHRFTPDEGEVTGLRAGCPRLRRLGGESYARNYSDLR
jgi:hypothetical protein